MLRYAPGVREQWLAECREADEEIEKDFTDSETERKRQVAQKRYRKQRKAMRDAALAGKTSTPAKPSTTKWKKGTVVEKS